MAPILFLVSCSCFFLFFTFQLLHLISHFCKWILVFFVLIFSQSITSWLSWFFFFLIQLSYYVLFFLQAIVFIIHLLLLQASTSQGFSLLNFYSLMTFSFSLLHINRGNSFLLSFFNFSWFVFFFFLVFLSSL
jgi:hypothetical protein